MDNHCSKRSQLSIVILYTELADYFVNCINELSNESVDVYIVKYPINKEAPFQFNNINATIKVFNREDYNLESLITLVNHINPTLIYCAGWNDKNYLKVVRFFKSKIPALLGFDNQWRGTIKQHLSVLYARLLLTPFFKYAFVPGIKQKKFALKLGFDKHQIFDGAYSANTSQFENYYLNQKQNKNNHFPHRFVFVGRYVSAKGIAELWEAFIELHKEHPNEWELWCLGVGNIEPVNHPKIKHFGFIQSKEIESILSQTGVFVLPSFFEPWGVVVHEFAAAGFPLLLSKHVGAQECFLNDGVNGFSFNSHNISEIKQALQKIILKDDADLVEMGNYSNELSKTISPKTWVNSILAMLGNT